MDVHTRTSDYSGTHLFKVSFSEATVTGSSRLKVALRAKIGDHFDVALATAGVVVAIVAMAAVLVRGDDNLVLLLVVWLQGLIFWTVRHHIPVGRELLVHKLRVMLQDRVNNQLTVLVGLTDIHAHTAATDDQNDVEIALVAARAVSREIETLSVESLKSWEKQYSQHLPSPLR
jgi:hypothetical protein